MTIPAHHATYTETTPQDARAFTMSLSAQDEVDRLFSQKERVNAHPEDSRENSISPTQSDQETTDTYVHSDGDDDDDDSRKSHKMSTTMTSTATYHLPTTVFDANTGPKGVIADAQSFDRAKKRSFRRTLMNFTSNQIDYLRSRSPEKSTPTTAVSSSPEASDEEEEFMRQWRQNRLQELSTMNGGQSYRRQSPSKRKYGTLDTVDANGYLDAVEKVPSDTVVVVCIYDPEVRPDHHVFHYLDHATDTTPQSNASAVVEDALSTIARKNPTTRFVKLHHEIAEMDHVGVPAILAYRAGEVFATLVDIDRYLPQCTSYTLDNLLREYVATSPRHHPFQNH